MANRALVTGAARRLGREMALALAGKGFDVAVHYGRSEQNAAELAELIRATGGNGVALGADFLDETQVLPLVDRASELLGGPLTVLVNNASVFEYDNIDTATRVSWDRHFESNLRAPFVLTQAFSRQVPEPTLDERGEPVAQGLVVNMLDQRVKKLTPEFMSYTLAKMGLWAFTQTAAQALAPAIRVNAIGPGPTVRGHRQSAQHFAKQRAGTVLQRGSNSGDVVGALHYFLEAPGVTGQLICTDGGQHLGWQTPDIVGRG